MIMLALNRGKERSLREYEEFAKNLDLKLQKQLQRLCSSVLGLSKKAICKPIITPPMSVIEN
ncbi:hypothetical protein DCAR_0207637 [Daucus carota subsp. sativus]|uniref:Uncharacterized protein n=1 Tax=Daucus carota subsp. sativus TaxID=79200 RepID=A0A161X4Q8_DAUCS|nr:hypothetical protein DCAR_0207637 [Daucus carota subsp. sativus]